MTSLQQLGRPQVVQVAPHGAGGVSDHLEHLQAAWHRQGWASQAWRLSQADVRADSLARRLLALRADNPAPCVLVLHFSGYGYASRGLCAWLLREVEGARAALGRQFRLVSVFHELYAKGPPWRTAFWTSPLQARIASQLARLSDAVWTNSSLHGAWLSRQAQPWAGLHVSPVFSNVGECVQTPASASSRSGVMVVFGAASTRQRACRAATGQGPELAALGVQEIVEVGPGPACMGSVGALPVRHAGLLAMADLSALLSASRFALLDYEARHLCKSSVFAAYAAHGCCIVNTNTELEPADGLVRQRHYHALSAPASAPGDLLGWMQLGQEAHRWYGQHNLPAQTQRWLQLLARVGHV